MSKRTNISFLQPSPIFSTLAGASLAVRVVDGRRSKDWMGQYENPSEDRDLGCISCKVGPYDRYKWSYGAPINGLTNG